MIRTYRLFFTVIISFFFLNVSAQQPVKWELRGATENGGVITKTGDDGWTGGGTSSNILAPNTDGWIEFTVTTQRNFFIGFVTNNFNAYNYNNFTNSIYIVWGGQIVTYEGTTGTNFNNVVSGDVMRISREGSQVKYYRNGSIFRTVTVSPSLELAARVNIYNAGADAPVVTASFAPNLLIRATVIGTGGTAATGSITVNTIGGTAPYTYTWSSGETTANISGKTLGIYTVTVTDGQGRVKTKSFEIGYKVTWPDKTGVTESGGTLTRASGYGWSVGANSSNILPANTDGWIEFVTNPFTLSYEIGFGQNNNAIYHYSSFQYGLYSDGNGIMSAFELGTATALGAWREGDVFRIARIGSSIKYYKNGVEVRSVATDPSVDMHLSAMLYNAGTTPNVSASFDARILPQSLITGTGKVNGTGSIVLNTAGGVGAYTYTWSSGENTSSIVNKNRGNYSVTITDAEGRTNTSTYNIGYKPYWSSKTNVTEVAGSLTKTSAYGWNSGALSTQIIPANTDGWLEFVTASSNTIDSRYAIGFAVKPSAAPTYQDFRNSIYVNVSTGWISALEPGVNVNLAKTHAQATLMRIQRQGSNINYYRNGVLMRTVTTNPAFELQVMVGVEYGVAPTVNISVDSKLSSQATVTGAGINPNSGSISSNVIGGTPPYSYSWSGGEQTSSINNKTAGTYNVTVGDTEGRSQNFSYIITSRSAWVDHLGVTDLDGSLTKTVSTGWGNAGANSIASLGPNTNGWVEFIANPGAYLYFIGFATTMNSFNYYDFTNAVYINSTTGSFQIYEGGSSITSGQYQPGDVFRVSREGSQMKTYRNGTVVRTATINPATVLRYKAVIHTGVTPSVTSSFEINAMRVVQDSWAFQYKYDARKRMIAKKVPGADWVYMVYDDRDRLVMTQDGELRKSNKWTFTKYDAMNRPIMTGVYTHNAALDQAGMSALISATDFYETYTGNPAQGNTHGYTNNVFPYFYYTYASMGNVAYPGSYLDIKTVTYYDDYAFKTSLGSGYDYVPNDVATQTVNGVTYSQPVAHNNRVQGSVTGTKVKSSDGLLLTTVTYYDEKYRVVQNISDSRMGGTDRTTTLVDFVGKTLAVKTTSNNAKLHWKNLLRTQPAGQGLVSINTSSGDSFNNYGATSVETLAANTNGWLEVTVSEVNTARFIGLASGNPGVGYPPITYAFQLGGFYLTVWESGIDRGLLINIQNGDVLRIERTGTLVKYYRNGLVVYTSTIPSSTALVAAASFWSHSSTLANIRASFLQPEQDKVTARTFTYDHAGRLIKTFHSVNGATPILLAQNEYNELGQLVDKKLYSTNSGSTFKQSVDYRYNIRGWLTSMNNSQLAVNTTNDDTGDLFGMNLLYEQQEGVLNNQQLYDGNISAMKWSNNLGLGTIKENAYTYGYDTLNRIKTANFLSGSTLTAFANPTGSFAESGFKYDRNGNILNLTRTDKTGTTIDNLTYDYGTGYGRSNKLLKVTDAGSTTLGFADGNTTGNDYNYDANGNMVMDKNKSINDAGIVYNYLNLPERVAKSNGDYIKYTYDATGRKLRQDVYNASGVLQKKTDYAGEYIYQNDTLQFINHEEGRVVMTGAAPEYQYHLKDHLGNVRTTFTTKDEVVNDKATYETADAASDMSKFLRYDNAKRVQAFIFDRTNGVAPTTTPGYAERLNGTANEKYGLAKSISVMPGDVINAEVYVKYVDLVQSNWTAALNTLMGQIAGGAAGVVIDGSAYANSTSSFPVSYGGLLSKSDNGAPKAYLNWLVFDRNYVFQPAGSGFKQITTAGKEAGTDVAHELIASPTINITQPGYVYIYLSNEAASPVEVYFDDFKVTHTKSPVIQTDDYYPFGLTFNSYKRENSVENKIRFQGQEHVDDLGINWDSFKWRNHQPDIGRFFNIDPLSEKYYYNSPYAFSENKVIAHFEIEGLESASAILGTKIQSAAQGVQNDINEAYLAFDRNIGNPVANFVSETIEAIGSIPIPFQEKSPSKNVNSIDGTNAIVWSFGSEGENNPWLPKPGKNSRTLSVQLEVVMAPGAAGKPKVPHAPTGPGERVKALAEGAKQTVEGVQAGEDAFDQGLDSTYLQRPNPENPQETIIENTSKATGKTRTDTLDVPIRNAPLN